MNATPQSYVIGFDLRLPADSHLDGQWPANRRALFLLRPEIARPLSVDRMVWPSLFEFPGSNLLASRDAGCVAFETTRHREVCSLLWSDLPRMTAAIPADIVRLGKSCETVRIDLETEAAVTADGAWGYLLDDPILDDRVQGNWQFLGYDIADAALCSALSNCGYQSSERAQIADIWAARLNEAGLMRDWAAARAFCDLSDRRIREHAPFFVLALYRLAQA
ncbi:MAG: hypothetical protein ACREEP_09695 [Dongiaceae bacterium]